jgi:hypothetical protein
VKDGSSELRVGQMDTEKGRVLRAHYSCHIAPATLSSYGCDSKGFSESDENTRHETGSVGCTELF